MAMKWELASWSKSKMVTTLGLLMEAAMRASRVKYSTDWDLPALERAKTWGRWDPTRLWLEAWSLRRLLHSQPLGPEITFRTRVQWSSRVVTSLP